MRADDHLCRDTVGSDLATNEIQSTHRRLFIIIDWDRSVGRSADQSRVKTPLLLMNFWSNSFTNCSKKIEWYSVDSKDWLCINHRSIFLTDPIIWWPRKWNRPKKKSIKYNCIHFYVLRPFMRHFMFVVPKLLHLAGTGFLLF